MKLSNVYEQYKIYKLSKEIKYIYIYIYVYYLNFIVMIYNKLSYYYIERNNNIKE